MSLPLAAKHEHLVSDVHAEVATPRCEAKAQPMFYEATPNKTPDFKSPTNLSHATKNEATKLNTWHLPHKLVLEKNTSRESMAEMLDILPRKEMHTC